MVENNLISSIRYGIDCAKFLSAVWPKQLPSSCSNTADAYREIRTLFEVSLGCNSDKGSPSPCPTCEDRIKHKINPNVIQFYNMGAGPEHVRIFSDTSGVSSKQRRAARSVFAVYTDVPKFRYGGDILESFISDVLTFCVTCKVQRVLIWLDDNLKVDWNKIPSLAQLTIDTVMVRYVPRTPRTGCGGGGGEKSGAADDFLLSFGFPRGCFAGVENLIVSVGCCASKFCSNRKITQDKRKKKKKKVTRLDGTELRSAVSSERVYVHSECRCCIPFLDRGFNMQTGNWKTSYAHFIDGSFWEVRNAYDPTMKVWCSHCITYNVPEVRVLALDPRSTETDERCIARSILATNKSLPYSVEMIYNDPNPSRTLLPASWLCLARKQNIKIRTGRFAQTPENSDTKGGRGSITATTHCPCGDCCF